jgi:hypothetical protein
MLKIEVVPVISLRLRITKDDATGPSKPYQTKSYLSAPAIAREWAELKNREWEQRTFAPNGGAAYHNMSNADLDASEKREWTLYRRALPIFRALLAQKP